MGTTANVNMMVGGKFTLLGAQLNAGFEKNDAGQRIFVFQDLSTPNEGVTIDQLVSDVKRLMGKTDADPVNGLSADDIKGKLSAVAKSNPGFEFGAVRIVLQTVFLDLKIPKVGASSAEYAFKVDVIAEGLIPEDIKLINIQRLTLAVWNTDNDKVKKQLAISIDSAT